MSIIDYTLERPAPEGRRTPHAAPEYHAGRREPVRPATTIHPALAFLSAYGVSPNILMQAMSQAAASGVRPETALLASGLISPDRYYRALARHLGLPFIDGPAELDARTGFPQSITSGVAPLAAQNGAACWLLAPSGQRLDDLLNLQRRGALPRNRFALTTPAHLAKLVFERCADKIADTASHDLARTHGARYSANFPAGLKAMMITAAVLASLAAVFLTGGVITLLASTIFALFMSASIVIRLLAAAASCDLPPDISRKTLRDTELPVYTIVVALYREANIATSLIRALNQIDYPAGRLDIKLVIETDDHETREALEAQHLPARYEIIIAPEGKPRTKPRALNVALPLARGSIICVFDAEDIPESFQLREAAELFAVLPQTIACLQGRLAIDNHPDGWLARCFALEYAMLFDVINTGLSALNCPVPLGGTSNHFRTDILQKIGGWDAWNVTEDIDLGLRLARFGYQTRTILATTFEEAPAKLVPWMRQRRRWFKGWIQTFLVHFANPRATFREMGALNASISAIYVSGTIAGAMLGPVFVPFFIYEAATGNLLSPSTWLELVASTLCCFVALAGLFSAYWPSILGMRRRSLTPLAPVLLLLPAYWLLMTIAAWWALLDFLRNPFHWLKTGHGLAKSRRPLSHK